jgi:pre-rRNA-processing protein TSR1
VHKFDRYLHPGRTAAASFIGPVTWGAVPCLYFKREKLPEPEDAVEDLAQDIVNNQDKKSGSDLTLIATGTSIAPSTSRVIAKRIILTGHPYKIHRKLVTVRYMFFNPEDVQYFRALQLWTKRGRSGFIKEALGTHGYFKASFDDKVNPMDAVAVSLYKRVWPRNAVRWTPDRLEVGNEKFEDGLGSNMGLGDKEMSSYDPLESDELMEDEILNPPEDVSVGFTSRRGNLSIATTGA